MLRVPPGRRGPSMTDSGRHRHGARRGGCHAGPGRNRVLEGLVGGLLLAVCTLATLIKSTWEISSRTFGPRRPTPTRGADGEVNRSTTPSTTCSKGAKKRITLSGHRNLRRYDILLGRCSGSGIAGQVGLPGRPRGRHGRGWGMRAAPFKDCFLFMREIASNEGRDITSWPL